MQTQLSVLEQYAISSLITFLTAFVAALAAQLQTSGIDPSTIGWSVVSGIAWVALRAGVKAVIEYLAGINGTHTVTSQPTS